MENLPQYYCLAHPDEAIKYFDKTNRIFKCQVCLHLNPLCGELDYLDKNCLRSHIKLIKENYKKIIKTIEI